MQRMWKDSELFWSNIGCLGSQRSSGVCVFTLKNLYKPQSGCQREHDNRNSFILHSSILPKLIVGHCVSAVKSEVCTFECSHGAYTILTLLWFSNSRTQSFLKLNYGLLTQLLFWWSQCKRKHKCCSDDLSAKGNTNAVLMISV